MRNVHKVRIPDNVATVEPGKTHESMISPARSCRIVGMLPVDDVDYDAFELVAIFIDGQQEIAQPPVALRDMLTGPLSSYYQSRMIHPFPAGSATVVVRNASSEPQPFSIDLLVQEIEIKKGGN